jgi:hypothetical protein
VTAFERGELLSKIGITVAAPSLCVAAFTESILRLPEIAWVPFFCLMLLGIVIAGLGLLIMIWTT